MTGESSKRRFRIENKKKKMAALLDIAKLNEYDRAQKTKQKQEIQSPSSPRPETEPSPKRLKSTKGECIDRDEALEEPPPPKIGEIGLSGKPKLEGDEFIALKKALREKTQKIRNQPNFKLRELGENASLTTDINDRVPMFLSDLQHLIMYSQLGVHAPYLPSRWCNLEKYNRLVNTNVLVIENVSLYHFVAYESLFPFLSSAFDHKLEMITPASYKSDIVKDLSMVPLSGLYNIYL
nr:unnamed protein product [Callosobruchus chinensis]